MGQGLPRHGPKDQPHFVELQALRVVTSIIRREDVWPSRKAGEVTVSGRGGSRGPQLARNLSAHMAEQRQW